MPKDFWKVVLGAVPMYGLYLYHFPDLQIWEAFMVGAVSSQFSRIWVNA